MCQKLMSKKTFYFKGNVLYIHTYVHCSCNQRDPDIILKTLLCIFRHEFKYKKTYVIQLRIFKNIVTAFLSSCKYK